MSLLFTSELQSCDVKDRTLGETFGFTELSPRPKLKVTFFFSLACFNQYNPMKQYSGDVLIVIIMSSE